MAAVVDTCLDAWDVGRYELKYIGTYNTNARRVIKPFIALRAFFHFIYLMLFWRPQIVHVHFAAGVSFLRKSFFILWAQFTAAKVVLHCHAPNFDAFYRRCPRPAQAYIRLTLNISDTLIVLSEFWHHFFKGLSLRVPIVKLYNAVVCPPEIIRSNDDKPVILTLGRLSQRKGVYDLLKAVPGVLAHAPTANFWLGGDGEVEQVKIILSKQSWGERVRLLGWVRDKEKKESLERAGIFLLPSYQEGFPVAILEAMSYGLPVISTPVGGIPELVVDGETGFLVAPGDIDAMVQKITLLLDNPELAARMGAAGWRRIQERFDAGVMIQQLFDIYDSHTERFNGLSQDARRSRA